MKIRFVTIDPQVSSKILSNHNLKEEDVIEFFEKNISTAYIEKVGGNQYMAIGESSKGYITVFFTYKRMTAEVRTAYLSSKWQIKLYKKKRRK